MKPITDHPAHQQIVTELGELNAARVKVEKRIAEIDGMLDARMPDGDSSRVAAALEYSATGVVKAPTGEPSALREERSVLCGQVEPLQAAITQRHDALSSLAGALLAEIRRDVVKPRHRVIAKKALEAVMAYGAEVEAEFALQREMSRAGYSDHLGNSRVYAEHFGRPSDPGSLLAHLMRELRAIAD